MVNAFGTMMSCDIVLMVMRMLVIRTNTVTESYAVSRNICHSVCCCVMEYILINIKIINNINAATL